MEVKHWMDQIPNFTYLRQKMWPDIYHEKRKVQAGWAAFNTLNDSMPVGSSLINVSFQQ